jgi:hypothetical protein
MLTLRWRRLVDGHARAIPSLQSWGRQSEYDWRLELQPESHPMRRSRSHVKQYVGTLECIAVITHLDVYGVCVATGSIEAYVYGETNSSAMKSGYNRVVDACLRGLKTGLRPQNIHARLPICNGPKPPSHL